MIRKYGEIRPRIVFVENVPNLLKLGLGIVLGDLASIGYNAKWCVLGSKDCGGVHKRNRLWILAVNADSIGLQEKQSVCSNVGQKNQNKEKSWDTSGAISLDGVKGYVESHISGKDDKIPYSMDRFKAIGNAQDPRVAATSFRILSELLTK